MGQIFELIGKAMTDIGSIGKDSYNPQQKFKYRGVDAVMNSLHPVMQKYGLFAVPDVLNQVREERITDKGGTLKYSILTVKYTMFAPDGSSVCATVIGEGMDSGDKASNKAMSVAFKYAMFQLFCIPTEDFIDPDSETPPDNRPKQEQPKPAPAKPAPAKSLKTLMQAAIDVYGKEEAKDRFEDLMNQAGCTRQTMNEEYYDTIYAWIMEDQKNGVA